MNAVSVPVLAGFGPDGLADDATARRAASAWLRGGLVAVPTETVYGLAADAQDPAAVAEIYRAKGRPAGHPLIVHIADRAALRPWSAGSIVHAEALAEAFWPGPLTVVVRRSDRAGDQVTGGQDTVAVRCPGHPVALACLRAITVASGDPARGVAAPSANRFGRVSPTSAAAVVAELGDRLDPQRDLVVDGGPSAVGVESTIVDCTGPWPRVLRPGAIDRTQIDAALSAQGFEPLGTTELLRDGAELATAAQGSGAVPGGPEPETGPDSRGTSDSPNDVSPEPPRTPGMLESHYAPVADVIVLNAEESPGSVNLTAAGLIALAVVPTPPRWTRLAAPDSAEEYAHGLYAALRAADELGVTAVVAVLPELERGPLAGAIADRLRRAAHGTRHGVGPDSQPDRAR